MNNAEPSSGAITLGDGDADMLRRSPRGAIPHSVSIRLDADGMAYAGDPSMFLGMT